MPKVVNDDMVSISEDMKVIIRRIGYQECARLTGKSASYMRCLSSRGPKRIRRSDLRIIDMARSVTIGKQQTR